MSTKNKSKILFIDIETAPLVSYTWGLWEQNVIDVKQDWYVMCFAYRWLGDRSATSVGFGTSRSDRGVMHRIHKLLDEAKIVVAHNGDKFDIRKINARLAFHKFAPPSPYLTVDTKKVAKKYFGFDSNSLDNLGKYLGLGRKEKTGGFDLWLRCMAGDGKAIDNMMEYCANDVDLLHDVYMELLPWMSNHPNMSGNQKACPKCSGKKLHRRGKARSISGLEYQRFQCQDCGGWCRDRISEEAKPQVK